jgi:hypothetical protein
MPGTDTGAPPPKTSSSGRTSSHTTETMPGGGPQTETIAITQGHLPPNAESPPAAPTLAWSPYAGTSYQLYILWARSRR